MLPALPELLSLPLLILVAAAGDRGNGGARSRWWIAGVILGLPLLQLVPLPPELWVSLPGRRSVADAYATAGSAPPWLPVSLAPAATERFWLALLPPVALFLAVPHLDEAARRRLAHLAILVGLVSVGLGLGQIAGGPDSPLRLYATASRSDAVGLFANRNHHATFLALLVVLAGALSARRGGLPLAERAWLAATGSVFLLGIAASGSRAGLLLGVGACLAVAWILGTAGAVAGRSRSVAVWGGIAAAPLLVGLAVFGAATLRLQAEAVSGDLRWQIARGTWRAVTEVFPVGGGFGSFERLYARTEGPEELIPAVVNNAHNDWLELVLEGGLPALLLLACALTALLRATVSRAAGRENPFRRAALAALWLCALHATVDYPLRTMSVSLILALACGLGTAEFARSPASARRPPAASGARASSDEAGTGSSRTMRQDQKSRALFDGNAIGQRLRRRRSRDESGATLPDPGRAG
ncbi:O-antigen ligase like membrane protein [Methylobacterium sp. 174MFSha1.1]|uniref:O-antigen ligase family protein n=1 Tax=Methylobacterium sp. 174MFSha1.1 TaxID=1502749 RepID=UPI0008F42EF9|nr:O-antigen ligase family protein [Methylobacterium sp. 174MFSha1.1]SFU46988.1 O-antigen ligase like membrane protein [Methylobacterium sp. 174MFSha1.1]